jgi:hypothetical protein
MYALLILDKDGNYVLEHVSVNEDDNVQFSYKDDYHEFHKAGKCIRYVQETYPSFNIYVREFDIKEVLNPTHNLKNQ